jgi:hypothetical protein
MKNNTVVNLKRMSILFSYETPVAIEMDGDCYVTTRKWSKTTSKHVNRWLNGRSFKLEKQEFFNNLLV